MVAAKTDIAHEILARAFAAHTIERGYIAAVWGRIAAKGEVRGAIGRDPRQRKKIAVTARGGQVDAATSTERADTLAAAVTRWPERPQLERDGGGPLPRAHLSVKVSALTPLLRSAVTSLDAHLAIYEVSSMRRVIGRQTWFYTTFGTFFMAFGICALLLAAAAVVRSPLLDVDEVATTGGDHTTAEQVRLSAAAEASEA